MQQGGARRFVFKIWVSCVPKFLRTNDSVIVNEGCFEEVVVKWVPFPEACLYLNAKQTLLINMLRPVSRGYLTVHSNIRRIFYFCSI